MEATPARPIENYLDLVRVMRERVAQINSTFEHIDALAGLSARYTGKLLCDPPLKGMGVMSLFCLLDALALKLRIEPDPVALAKLRQRQSWTEMVRNGPRYRPSPASRRKREFRATQATALAD